MRGTPHARRKSCHKALRRHRRRRRPHRLATPADRLPRLDSHMLRAIADIAAARARICQPETRCHACKSLHWAEDRLGDAAESGYFAVRGMLRRA